MRQATRSALTLTGLGLLVAAAAAWGWSAFTAPFPGDEPAPVCVDTSVAAGEEIFRDQVVVSVFNGSKRSGLAAATMEQLTGRGFVAADTGNAPAQTPSTQIWSDDPANPAVQLVQRQFKGAKVVPGEALGAGVVVVVGDKFKALRPKDVESVVAETDTRYCAAPGSE